MREPRAALRTAATALLMGVLVAPGISWAEAEPAPPPPAAAAGAGCVHDSALEAAVTRALKKKVRDIEPTRGAEIEIAIGCPVVPDARHVTALAAHGHGGFLSALDLDVDHGPGNVGEVRALRLQPAAAPALGGPPAKISWAVARPRDEAVRHALAFASTALASTIRVVEPPPHGAAHSVAVVATTHDEALEIHVAGRGGQSWSRRWDGYVDSMHAGERVPLEVAWEALWGLAGGQVRSAPPDDAQRAAFLRLIEGDSQRPRLVNDGLLEAGAVLATRAVVPSLTPFLQASSERTRTLAVNALATATGTDLRRDATGAVRPLADVVAAYRALTTGGPARHD
jgi:hypothetical protein